MKLEEMVGRRISRTTPVKNRSGSVDRSFTRTKMITLVDVDAETMWLQHEITGEHVLPRDRWDDGNWKVVG